MLVLAQPTGKKIFTKFLYLLKLFFQIWGYHTLFLPNKTPRYLLLCEVTLPSFAAAMAEEARYAKSQIWAQIWGHLTYFSLLLSSLRISHRVLQTDASILRPSLS